MESNNKILFLAILILLVGIVSFNFNTISGAPVKKSREPVVTILTTELDCPTQSGKGYRGGVVYPEFMVIDASLNQYDKRVTIRNGITGERVATAAVGGSGSRIDNGKYSFSLGCDQVKSGEKYNVALRDAKSGDFTTSRNTFSVY